MFIVLFPGEVGHGQIWGTSGNMPLGKFILEVEKMMFLMRPWAKRWGFPLSP
jgi:hypothetical protein